MSDNTNANTENTEPQRPLFVFPYPDQVVFAGQYAEYPVEIHGVVRDCTAITQFMPRAGGSYATWPEHLEADFRILPKENTFFSFVRDLDLYVDLGQDRLGTLQSWLKLGWPVSAAHIWLAYGVLDTVAPTITEMAPGRNGGMFLTAKKHPSGINMRTITDVNAWDAVRVALKATMFPPSAVTERDPNAGPGTITRGRLPSIGRGVNPSYYGARPAVPAIHDAPLPHAVESDRLTQLEAVVAQMVAQNRLLLAALQGSNGRKSEPEQELESSIPF